MKPTLITGGAGFIGTNLAHRLLSAGQPVIVLDNLSRTGVDANLRWLATQHPGKLKVEVADIRDAAALRKIVPRASAVYHFAAQTAVTTSMVEPEHDFDVNARGTLRLLEAIKACSSPPTLLFTSTNKVYGGLSDVALHCVDRRYRPVDERVRADGISEARPLDFHTPYGCSKGTADQYVLEYARSFGLPATLFRMSCIYGPHQCGCEDQGWVAHFAIRALEQRTINIYGDGMQVRDLLYVDDLVDALLLAGTHIEQLRGEAFNIGGGVANVASLLDVIEQIEGVQGRRCSVEFADWRPSDQRYYVSDTRKFERLTGWRPRVNVQDGIEKLYGWQLRERKLPAKERKRAAAGSSERSEPKLVTADSESQ
jgi:CDP-paratose 2-epimerase